MGAVRLRRPHRVKTEALGLEDRLLGTLRRPCAPIPHVQSELHERRLRSRLMTAPVYTVEEQTVVLPVRIRDAASIYASFLVPAAAVKRLLPAGLTPLQTIPGRATCTIVGVDYREGDLGKYHEVGVCFLLRPTDGPRLDVLARVRNQAPAYIHRLRVTTSFSCEAGRHIW